MDYLTLAWFVVIDFCVITAAIVYWAEDEVEQLGKEEKMTLAEFLDERTRDETALMIFHGDKYGNYENPCNDEKYGVETVKDFKQWGYAKTWLKYRVKHILTFFNEDGLFGYMVWVRRPDWDDALAKERGNDF